MAYRGRNATERMLSPLKNLRSVASRHDRSENDYLAADWFAATVSSRLQARTREVAALLRLMSRSARIQVVVKGSGYVQKRRRHGRESFFVSIFLSQEN